MKTIAVDMDGVLANVFQQYVALDERHTGRKRSAEDVRGIPEMEAFERAREYILSRGFFRNAPLSKTVRTFYIVFTRSMTSILSALRRNI